MTMPKFTSQDFTVIFKVSTHLREPSPEKNFTEI